MKTVIFIHGLPCQGKSYLANILRARHSFEILWPDEAYVEFIKNDCPMLYFDALEKYISPHYHHVLAHRSHSLGLFGRDFYAEWLARLAKITEEYVDRHRKVALEGYLLKDFMESFSLNPPSSVNARVFQVEVVNRSYRLNGNQVTIEQIAALGSDPSADSKTLSQHEFSSG